MCFRNCLKYPLVGLLLVLIALYQKVMLGIM
uniref:Hefutoxin family n=1 Tax=Siphoviridae sp. ctJ0s2 TaxID=2827834 RepID=A0A8S5TEY4_9CAUD|nr:MAG TPA: Hefutoxin family [Siphoviridae sp. ctJ0s2]DAX19965.1 MAG TPA: Hefutoxin family [Caudoviricetes sp.]